ncbi:382_t:CDS:2 [Rhizophagus irregularis]|nr:382_t:CDS:2 [Rhizophagus irregularis]
MSTELDKLLIRDISRLYEDSDDHNVQIQVGHGSNDEYLGFGSDLEWFAGICEQNDYQQKIYNGIEFIMEDYEVFQVVKL